MIVLSFSGSRALIEPLNKFVRFMTQTMRFRARKFLFGVMTTIDVISNLFGGKMRQNPTKVGAGNFKPNMPKSKKSNISKTINPMKSKFQEQVQTTNYSSRVVYHCPSANPTWLTAAILKSVMTS